MKQVLDKHYRRLARDYDQFLYYSPEFVRALTSKMVELLALRPEDRLADIGCGTGMYSLDILEQVPLAAPVLGVDPYPEMLAQIPEGSGIEPLALDALAFSREDRPYNKVLIKETIHHVEARDEFFAHLHERLPSGGRLLLVHVPPDVKYPLFPAALARCLTWHADPQTLLRQLAAAGFDTSRDELDFPHRLPKEHYHRMVRSCYMSVLTSFSPEELAAGLAEMEEAHAGLETLEFIDHFDYLLAVKP